MPLTFIPERHHAGFKKIATITEEVFAKIQEGLSYTSLTSSIETLSSKVAELKNLESADLKQMFSSVGSLSSFLEDVDLIKDVVDDISNLIEVEEDKERFKERLIYLFESRQIFYASKASELKSDYGNSFILCRIITDIRPVFDVNIHEAPKAGMIIHNLHFHYQSGEEPYHKNLTLTLDSSDIWMLRDTLDRAITKEDSLQSLFENSNMTNLDENLNLEEER